jgi:hypothetical protein
MKEKKSFIFNLTIAISSIVLILSAIIHRLQLNNSETYRNSFLIHVEMTFMIILFALIIINFFVLLVHLFKKNWKQGIFSFIFGVLLMIAIVISMAIDSPTLVYMT